MESDRSMTNTLWGRIPGCALGFLAAALVLPAVDTDTLPMLALGACLLAILYMIVRLVTRAVTLAFDLILFGLPRLFLEAVILLGLSHIVPGMYVRGYWSAMAMLLCGLGGMAVGRRIVAGKESRL